MLARLLCGIRVGGNRKTWRKPTCPTWLPLTISHADTGIEPMSQR